MASLLARAFRTIGKISLATSIGMGLVAGDALAQQAAPSPGSAKAVFGAVTLPTQGSPQSIGFYAKGCLAGAVALPADGPLGPQGGDRLTEPCVLVGQVDDPRDERVVHVEVG